MKNLMKLAEQDLAHLLKVADERGIRLEFLKSIAKPMVGALAAAGVAGVSAAYFTKKDRERHKAELMSSMKSLVTKDPALAKKPELFLERFGELTVISPTIAKNPSLAAKLLSKNLSKGFSVDDIHKLTQIEFSASNSRVHAPHPMAAGRAAANHALGTVVNVFGRDILEHVGNARERLHDQLDSLKQDVKRKESAFAREMKATSAGLESLSQFEIPDDDMNKESSVQKVSDECLGTMLAERYVMLKTAGVGDLMTAGAKGAVSSLAYYAPALALGGGVALVRHALESRRNQQLEQQADNNYKALMKDSETLRENKDIALEAFGTLKAVAPSLAARPLVAKTFIEYVTSQGRLPPETIKQLAETESQIRGIGGSHKGGFFSDLKSSMGLMEPKTVEKLEGFGRTKVKKGFL